MVSSKPQDLDTIYTEDLAVCLSHLNFCKLLALLSLKPFLVFLLLQLQLVLQLLPKITDNNNINSVIVLRSNQ